jgi:hypothetical protein
MVQLALLNEPQNECSRGSLLLNARSKLARLRAYCFTSAASRHSLKSCGGDARKNRAVGVQLNHPLTPRRPLPDDLTVENCGAFIPLLWKRARVKASVNQDSSRSSGFRRIGKVRHRAQEAIFTSKWAHAAKVKGAASMRSSSSVDTSCALVWLMGDSARAG